MEIIIGFHSPEIFDVLFLCWLVWVSLYLFSIFWCIYFPLETKTDNEVSFIQRLTKILVLLYFSKIKFFRPEMIEQEIGHSALNRICIIAWPRQLFWQISTEFLLDNFFTSVDLVDYLLLKKTYSSSTIQLTLKRSFQPSSPKSVTNINGRPS